MSNTINTQGTVVSPGLDTTTANNSGGVTGKVTDTGHTSTTALFADDQMSAAVVKESTSSLTAVTPPAGEWTPKAQENASAFTTRVSDLSSGDLTSAYVKACIEDDNGQSDNAIIQALGASTLAQVNYNSSTSLGTLLAINTVRMGTGVGQSVRNMQEQEVLDQAGLVEIISGNGQSQKMKAKGKQDYNNSISEVGALNTDLSDTVEQTVGTIVVQDPNRANANSSTSQTQDLHNTTFDPTTVEQVAEQIHDNNLAAGNVGSQALGNANAAIITDGIQDVDDPTEQIALNANAATAISNPLSIQTTDNPLGLEGAPTVDAVDAVNATFAAVGISPPEDLDIALEDVANDASDNIADMLGQSFVIPDQPQYV